MKRIITLLFLILIVGCEKTEGNEMNREPITITEKMFLTQINDVYFNFNDYDGKILKVEGMYGFGDVFDETYHAVYRLGPGCCENDGWGGFLLNYDGKWPEEDAWIEVQGTPRIERTSSANWLYLDVISITIKEERGLEIVTQ